MLHENSTKVTAVVTGEAELGKHEDIRYLSLPLVTEGHPEITEWAVWFHQNSCEPLEKMLTGMGFDSQRHPLNLEEFPKEAIVEFFQRVLSKGTKVVLIIRPNTFINKDGEEVTENQVKSVRLKLNVSNW